MVAVVTSTHSIYYEKKDGRNENLQMVIKTCIPARAVLGLVGKTTK